MKGLYIYGEVGTGKTMMMDTFYQCSKVPKRRVHYDEFMNEIHEEMWKYTSKQMGDEAISKISKDFVGKYQLLCFDELQFPDIGIFLL